MRARMLVLVAVALLATACGGGEPAEPPRIPTQAPPSTPASETPAPDPLTATPPPGGVQLPAERVDASALPAGFPTLVWTRGPRTLGVFGRAGGCTEARAELVEQGASRIVVRVTTQTTSPGPCTRELRYPPLEMALASDLGERRVVLRD